MIRLLSRLWFIVLFLAAPAAAQGIGPGYVLGPEDSITVVVYGQPEAGITTRIKADGSIVMPLIGNVKAEGQTNITLAKLIADKLVSGGFLKEPVVNVEITTYTSRTANVAGKITSPGIYPLDRPQRVLDVLLRAGWVRENGATYVYLRRAGQAEQRLDVEQLVRGDDKSNPLVLAGDTLFVPDAEVFYIQGQINSPGMKPILPGMTIRQAIGFSGGVTATGKADKVGLIRGNAKEVDADGSQLVQKGDVIIVKERLF